jgi:hypothetical protein
MNVNSLKNSLGSLLILPFFATSCATVFPARTIKSEGSLRVLEFKTGTIGSSLYEDNFKALADKECAGKKYSVIEQSHSPAIYKCAKEALDPEKFYWVIKCDN